MARFFAVSAIALSSFLVVACSQVEETTTTPQELSPAAPMLQRAQAQLQPQQQPQPQANQKLAITHNFSIRAPSARLEEIHRKHLEACAKAGCTVLNTRLDKGNDGRISARTSLRISPDQYQAFSSLLLEPPAELVSQSSTTDDRTIAILDIEKRIESKQALRARLTALLQDPIAKNLADVLAIEKELAQVQSDIESAAAQRDYLTTITETIRVDIQYSSTIVVVRGNDYSPIKQAIDSIGKTFIASLAWLISLIVAVLPWIPVIWLLVWGVRRGMRRWRGTR